jgi:hypothetical protein
VCVGQVGILPVESSSIYYQPGVRVEGLGDGRR